MGSPGGVVIGSEDDDQSYEDENEDEESLYDVSDSEFSFDSEGNLV